MSLTWFERRCLPRFILEKGTCVFINEVFHFLKHTLFSLKLNNIIPVFYKPNTKSSQQQKHACHH